jgi:two-component system, cell cycle sensor histidine kinase and response regulator CckA
VLQCFESMPEVKAALKASKQLLASQNLALEMIVSGAPLDDVLRAVSALIELRDPPAKCAIFVPDPDGSVLRLKAAPNLPESFARVLDGLPIGPLAGASGAAAYRKERVIVPNMAVDPLYQYSRELIRKHPLRSCWSTPILSRQGALLGVITVYRKRSHVPNQREIDAVEQVARLARIAIERLGGEADASRKGAEPDLISSQDGYRELFENANEVMYTHDLGGRLTALNKAGVALTGYSREEAMGMNMSTLVAPEYRRIWREKLDSQIGGEAKTTYELEIVNRSGARISLETGTRLIFRVGKPVAVQGIARDVTERRRLEAHLLQSQKMEAIGRLAGGVAHDFNNMLTVITGYSQWMLDELPPESPMCESASEILLAANRAAALTNQLLVFSRNQVIQPIIVDLNDLVAQMDQMLRRLIGENIELVTKTYPDLGLIRGDPGQIEQVILNLAVNARDAMPRGGRLILETANVHIYEEHEWTQEDCIPGAYVMLAVSDSGSGIDEEVKAHIFEPFFTTKAQGRGTGLGLSTVYGIVKHDGGHIRVESEPGVGTVFRIYFPRVGDPPLPKIIPRPRARSRGTETILLVEDEIALRRIVGEMLARLGYTVVESPDSRSAEKVAADYGKPIQLLLTDVVMPELGGWDLASRLKAVRSDLKVLFMSGYTDDTIVQQGVLEAGAAYLQKPFTPDALANKIREVLDNTG